MMIYNDIYIYTYSTDIDVKQFQDAPRNLVFGLCWGHLLVLGQCLVHLEPKFGLKLSRF